MTASFTIATLDTPRLTLRAPRAADFDAYAQALSGGQARFMGGPFSRAQAWTDWCVAVAEWVLHRLGPWTLTEKGGEAPLGWASLSRHPACPEPELGWLLTEAAQGKGYATEAGCAVIAHGFGTMRLASLVSYIRPGNTRAERLAARLGARREPGTPALPGTIAHRYPHPEATA